jgi:hypothetical protein
MIPTENPPVIDFHLTHPFHVYVADFSNPEVLYEFQSAFSNRLCSEASSDFYIKTMAERHKRRLRRVSNHDGNDGKEVKGYFGHADIVRRVYIHCVLTGTKYQRSEYGNNWESTDPGPVS